MKVAGGQLHHVSSATRRNKKHPAQTLKVAGDLRRASGAFENPGQYIGESSLTFIFFSFLSCDCKSKITKYSPIILNGFFCLSFQVHQLQIQVSDLQRRADKVGSLCGEILECITVFFQIFVIFQYPLLVVDEFTAMFSLCLEIAQPRSQGLSSSRPSERERDPGWSWSRDSTRQTSPQSGYTRSIILFARADQRFLSGCDLSKRNARDLAQFHAVYKNRILSTI